MIGAGLAGCEAAYQAAEAGVDVVLYEMRPERQTAAHKTGDFAELVCSNSLKSESENSAPWQLKREMRALGSMLLRAANASRIPGGHALTVDREEFARHITHAIESHSRIEVKREEVKAIPEKCIVVVASGPLTSDALATDITRRTGTGRLFFYDSISPIVAADSVDMSIAFRASRWGKSLDGGDDYVNCPFTKAQYETFIDALLGAESYEAHIQEDTIPFFEGCLPIEEIARRGRDTLRFGPMKPAGLDDPRTGRWAYATVQLRQENGRADSYNLVGFQNHMRFAEQARVFRLIPGLENAEFLRFGQMHRNTYINSPALLRPTMQLRGDERIFFAGQISGVEGYTESIATGIVAGRNAAALALGGEPDVFPRASATGSLTHYITHADARHFQPANITFDLLPALDEGTRQKFKRDKKARHAEICRRAFDVFEEHMHANTARVGVEVFS